MASIVRVIILAVAALAAWVAPTARASEIVYSFDFSVRGMTSEMEGGPINVGDVGTMTFRVNAATPSDAGGVGWARYAGAIVGGGVTIGSAAWTFASYPEVDNRVVIWNDQPLPPNLVEGMEFLAGLQGPSINGFDPVSFSALLLSFNTVPSDALTSLSFPTSLDLTDFQYRQGLLEFFPFANEAFYLDLHGVRVTPEPSTLLLLALGIPAALLGRRTGRRVPERRRCA